MVFTLIRFYLYCLLCSCVLVFFFFFKQKTAYEMRISDWSSDVCSSDLQFWKIAFGLFACGYSMNLLGIHGVPMLMDHGFDAMTGSFGIGLIGFAAIFSTLVLGRMSDIIPRKNIQIGRAHV